MIQPTIKIKGKTNASIIKIYPELENLRVVPTREGQRFKSIKYGFNEVTVDGYIPKLQEKTVEPKIYEQEITVDSEFDGLSRVNIGEVTSAIDENIKPENIVTGINILGVEGTLVDTSDATAVAGDILKDKIAYVDNKKITGTIEDYTNNEIFITDENGVTLSTRNKYCKEDIAIRVQTEAIDVKPNKEEQNFEGLYRSVTVSGDPNLTPENIKTGTSIFDVEGALVDTSDATAVATDILKGKDAYVNNKKVTGSVENYDGSFNGFEEGTAVVDTADATATSEDIMLGKTAYANGRKIVGASSNDYNAEIVVNSTRFRIVENLKKIDFSNMDTSNVTYFSSAFSTFSGLEEVIGLNTSSGVNMGSLFYMCPKLKTIPVLDIRKASVISDMFKSCPNLSDDSLNNILEMCANNADRTSSNKLFSYIGLSSAQIEKCKTLPNYQAAVAAGWK